jgi:Tfp pilus assembly protein PilF
MDAPQQNTIFRKYGDFLYQKADYDGAMQQYLKAIDNTEPSQVIRKVANSSQLHVVTIVDSISFLIRNEYII